LARRTKDVAERIRSVGGVTKTWLGRYPLAAPRQRSGLRAMFWPGRDKDLHGALAFGCSALKIQPARYVFGRAADKL
jgi:hypothetical protein